jgi:tetratricopeptide (TPR) repeat protein
VSPSGWAFETSYQRAIDAYKQAFGLSRKLSVVIVTRLAILLPTQPGAYLPGFASAPDTGAFWAFPTLDHDTLAFVPFRQAEAQSVETPISPDALLRDREMLSKFVTRAADENPQSYDAQISLASILENAGQITGSGASALHAIRRALAVAGDEKDSLAAAITEARLLVKVGEFGRAHALADSVLAEWPTPPMELVPRVAALAVLVGQASRAADLLAMGAADVQKAWRDPAVRLAGIGLIRAQQRLLAYAAIGGPEDSINRWRRAVDTLLGVSVSADARERARNALLDKPMELAYPTIGSTEVHRQTARPDLYILNLQWLAANHRYASVRAELASLAKLRRGLPGNKLAVSAVYQEANLMVQVGDTAGAIAHLDGVLNGLQTIPGVAFDYVPEAAALGRAMVLRADLAAAQHDTMAAHTWRTAANALWSDADPGPRAELHLTR